MSGGSPHGSVRALAATVFVLTQIAFGSSARAAPGDLDESFGANGWVETRLSEPDAGAHADALAIQPDGAIIVAGGTGDSFALVRYRSDGSQDPSFGEDGVVTTSFGKRRSAAFGLTLQPDGRIIAVGFAANAMPVARSPSEGNRDAVASTMAVARYLPSGDLDTTFGGGDGKTRVRFGASSAAWAADVQPDGSILLAGDGDGGIAFARLTQDGALDEGFGTSGRAGAPLGRYYLGGFAFGLDTIVVVASSFDRLKVARFGFDGVLDHAFGGDGIRRYTLASKKVFAEDVALDASGQIVVALTGCCRYNLNPLDGWVGMLLRLGQDGDRDVGFSGDGVAFTGSHLGYAGTVALQGDDKTVVCGGRQVGGGSGEGVSVLVRFASDGTFDSTFGDGGMAEARPQDTYVGGCNDLAVQPDGRLVLVTDFWTGFVMAARFLAS